MPRKKPNIGNSDENTMPRTRSRPARTPEQREQQLINLAFDLVEQRLREGTATSQETTHFLKLGSSREKLEQKEKQKDIELKAAKTEAIQTAQRIETLYDDAIKAMRRYSGQGDDNEDEQVLY